MVGNTILADCQLITKQLPHILIGYFLLKFNIKLDCRYLLFSQKFSGWPSRERSEFRTNILNLSDNTHAAGTLPIGETEVQVWPNDENEQDWLFKMEEW